MTDQPQGQLFNAICETWLTFRRLDLAPTTSSVYQTIVRRGARALGHLHVRDITEDEVTAYLASLTDLKPGSRRLHYIVLRQIFAFAIRRGLRTTNPCDGVRPPRGPVSGGHALSEEEVHRFLDAIPHSRYHLLYLVAVLTGMRHGELAGLRWRDVDLVHGCLHVMQTRYRKFPPKEPKTRSGRRRIALPARLVEALKRWRESDLCGSDLVFSHHTEEPWITRGIVEEDLPRVLKRAGLPRIRLHDLRHTHATLLLAHGVSPHVVSQRLGHSTVAFTMQVYGHVLPGMQEEAARILEDRFFSEPLAS